MEAIKIKKCKINTRYSDYLFFFSVKELGGICASVEFGCLGVGEIARRALIANTRIGVSMPKLIMSDDNNGVVQYPNPTLGDVITIACSRNLDWIADNGTLCTL